jgi:hypothetical protein
MVVGVVALTPAVASAQQVNITPASSITPDSTVTSWIVWMGIATALLGVLIIFFLLFGYLRFAPKFFGREAPPKAAPGTRPAFTGRTPVDQRAPVGAVRPFSRGPEEATAQPASASAQPAASTSAVATLERPAVGEGKAEPSETGGTAEEPPPEEGSGGGAEDQTPPTEYEQELAEVEADEAAEAPAAQAEAPAAQAEAPAAQAEAAPTPAAQAPTAPPEAPAAPAEATATAPAAGAAPAATSHGGSTMDQETFDRVLQEQLGKGVDRRVAEGRARAAAVVAARKKAQG